MRHSYMLGCLCDKCKRECARRLSQANANPQPLTRTRSKRLRLGWGERKRKQPAIGSQEWAELSGDNLGLSEDR